MSHGRFAIIDPAAGISGDMLLGALVAAGAPVEWLRGLPRRLGYSDVSLEIAETDRGGIRCTKVTVRLPDGRTEEPYHEVAPNYAHAHEHYENEHHEHAGHEAPAHAHGHEPSNDGVHRHIGDLIQQVRAAELSEWVRERAIRAFRLLGEAEGRIHGLPADEVALHEVGAVDALIDIVGAIEGFEVLGLQTVYTRPVALGSGWVRAAHGVMAVPAPATALLLEGLEIGPSGPVSGEATTPTGAVLLRVLAAGAPPEAWRCTGSAWGAGGRNPAGYANALRLLIGESASEAGEVFMIATDIDDLSPEYIEPLREAMTAAGAIDVQVWASQMKKGRTGFRVEALAAPADADRVTAAVFRHSTTAGLRRWRAERVTIRREVIEVTAHDGTPVRVKLLHGPGGLAAKPEFDDVAALAISSGRPAHEMARELQWQALRLAGGQSASGPETQNTKES